MLWTNVLCSTAHISALNRMFLSRMDETSTIALGARKSASNVSVMFLSASAAAVLYFLRSFAPLSLMMAGVVKVLSAVAVIVIVPEDCIVCFVVCVLWSAVI